MIRAMNRTNKRTVVVFSCVWCALAASAVADNEPRGAKPSIEAKADAVLERMSHALGKAGAITFQATDTMDVAGDSGDKQSKSARRRFSIRRPDRLLSTVDGADGGRTLVYDGETITLFDESQNAYARVDAPATIEGMLDYASGRFSLPLPLTDLLLRDVYGAMTEGVTSGRYVGEETVDGTKCHHLAFTQADLDWEIWIDSGEIPLPRKLSITYKTEPKQSRYVATLSAWDLSPKLSDSVFAFAPPEGAQRIDIMPAFADAADADEDTDEAAQSPFGEMGKKRATRGARRASGRRHAARRVHRGSVRPVHTRHLGPRVARRPHHTRVLGTLPHQHTVVRLHDRTYYHHEGVYYHRTFHEGHVRYVSVRTPWGVRISVLPHGHTTVVISGTTFFHHDDVFYDRRYIDGTPVYVAVRPPIGATVTIIPEECVAIFVGGIRHHYHDGVWYQRAAHGGGATYIVVPPPIGATVYTLPIGCNTVLINGVTFYHLADTYYRRTLSHTGVTYTVVTRPY